MNSVEQYVPLEELDLGSLLMRKIPNANTKIHSRVVFACDSYNSNIDVNREILLLCGEYSNQLLWTFQYSFDRQKNNIDHYHLWDFVNDAFKHNYDGLVEYKYLEDDIISYIFKDNILHITVRKRNFSFKTLQSMIKKCNEDRYSKKIALQFIHNMQKIIEEDEIRKEAICFLEKYKMQFLYKRNCYPWNVIQNWARGDFQKK